MNAAKVEEGLRMLDAATRLQERAKRLIAEGTEGAPPAEDSGTQVKPTDEVTQQRVRKLLRQRGMIR